MIYVYDGADIAEEVDAAGSVLARYTIGQGIDQPLAMLRGGVTSYYHADGLGSITSLTDASGSLAATYSYDAFGKPILSTGTVVNPFRYTGREFDSETGLYYYRARYYDSGTGRLLSEDPNVMEASISMYVYAGNAAATYVDPLGFAKQRPMPALQPGVGKDQAEVIARGFHEALNRLKGGPCARFFGCKPEDPNSAAAKELGAILWGVFTDKKHPNVIAHTYTNADRAEFNTASGVFDNSGTTWESSHLTPYNYRVDFGYSEHLLAFYMLHELAHHFANQTNFQYDFGLPAINEQNSLMLINACFLDARKVVK
jgi:RHS repeat-associated protein